MTTTACDMLYAGVNPSVYNFGDLEDRINNRHLTRVGLMSGMLEKWVSEALDKSGLTQAELARRVTDRLGRTLDRAQVNKLTKGGRTLLADEMIAIAEITGQPLPGADSAPGTPESRSPGTPQDPYSGIDEDHLQDLITSALVWKGMTARAAENLAASLIEFARKPSSQETVGRGRLDAQSIAETLDRLFSTGRLRPKD